MTLKYYHPEECEVQSARKNGRLSNDDIKGEECADCIASASLLRKRVDKK